MKNKQLLVFFYRSAILIVILFAIDRLVGAALEYLYFKQNHGDNYVSIYLLEKAKEDIIVLGGSRASHHYNADMIEKNTKMSCFNGGRDEMIINYSAATLQEVYKRASPKVVILDIIPSELAVSAEKQLSLVRIAAVLMPFSHRHPELMNTIALADSHLPLKIQASRIYPYNSTIGASIQNSFTSLGHRTVKGYEPLKGAIDARVYTKSLWGEKIGTELPIDSISISALSNLIRLTKQHQTRFIVNISPFYFPVDFSSNATYAYLQQLAHEQKIELYDFSRDPKYVKKPELFYDDIHLNNQGATMFSDSISKIILKE